jgi:uncharacterized protein YggE
MNRFLTFLVALGVFAAGLFLGRDLLAPRSAQGQALSKGDDGKEDKHVLTTAGTASVRVKPDSARVFLRVDTQAADILTARALNNKHVKKVMDALKGLQIPNLKMKSDNITVSEVFERRPADDQLARVIGYRVSHHFTTLVENEDPAKLSEYAGRLLDTALSSGANSLQQVMIFRKDMTSARREALTKAVENALANARALAAGANKTVIAATTITDEPRYFYLGGNTRLQNTIQVAPGGGADGDGTPVMAGELEIACRVNLTCRF